MRTVRLVTAALAACLLAAVVIPWGTPASAQGRGAVAGRGAAPQGRGGGPAGDADAGGGRGSTIQGTVENFVPVSQEELHNPNPGDWLMLGPGRFVRVLDVRAGRRKEDSPYVRLLKVEPARTG